MTTIHRDDLEVLDRLGGSAADVRRATLRGSGRVVVVKRAPWSRPDLVARLDREAAALRAVDHPAVVRLLGVVEDEAGRALVLQHAPGGSLAHHLRTTGAMGPVAAADLAARLADGLASLHRAGVVHRDVHPGNVLIDAELRPLLADLDLALVDGQPCLAVDGEVVGHPAHVDHRLFASVRPGPASDLHALATTTWRAATGHPAPRAQPSSPVALPADGVPPALRAVLTGCLIGTITTAEEAAIRFRAAAADIATAAGGQTMGADQPERPCAAVAGPPAPPVATGTRRWGPAPLPPPSTPVPATGPSARRALIAALAAMATACLAGVLLLGTGRGEAAPPAAAPPAAVERCPQRPTTADTVLLDVDGDGCGEPASLTDGVLTTPEGRWRLGRADDVLLAGDWDGDGDRTPAIYRPVSGEVFLFDEAPGDGEVASRPALRLAPEGDPLVVRVEGRDTVRLRTTTA